MNCKMNVFVRNNVLHVFDGYRCIDAFAFKFRNFTYKFGGHKCKLKSMRYRTYRCGNDKIVVVSPFVRKRGFLRRYDIDLLSLLKRYKSLDNYLEIENFIDIGIDYILDYYNKFYKQCDIVIMPETDSDIIFRLIYRFGKENISVIFAKKVNDINKITFLLEDKNLQVKMYNEVCRMLQKFGGIKMSKMFLNYRRYIDNLFYLDVDSDFLNNKNCIVADDFVSSGNTIRMLVNVCIGKGAVKSNLFNVCLFLA